MTISENDSTLVQVSKDDINSIIDDFRTFDYLLARNGFKEDGSVRMKLKFMLDKVKSVS